MKNKEKMEHVPFSNDQVSNAIGGKIQARTLHFRYIRMIQLCDRISNIAP